MSKITRDLTDLEAEIVNVLCDYALDLQLSRQDTKARAVEIAKLLEGGKIEDI